MRKTVLALLFFAGGANLTLSSGCGCPPAIKTAVADIDSSSQANNQLFRRVLSGYAPTTEEAAHAQARMAALDNLTPKVSQWVQDH